LLPGQSPTKTTATSQISTNSFVEFTVVAPCLKSTTVAQRVALYRFVVALQMLHVAW